MGVTNFVTVFFDTNFIIDVNFVTDVISLNDGLIVADVIPLVVIEPPFCDRCYGHIANLSLRSCYVRYNNC